MVRNVKMIVLKIPYNLQSQFLEEKNDEAFFF